MAARVKCPHCKLINTPKDICDHLESIGYLVDLDCGLHCAACDFYDMHYREKIHHIQYAGHDWPKVLTRREMEGF